MSERKGTGVLLAIGLFKLVKAAALIALAAASISASKKDLPALLDKWIANLGLDPENRIVQSVLDSLSVLDERKMIWFGVAAIAYAGLFLVEGVGLVLRKSWAEWFTSIITGSFIPIEVYEVVHKASPVKFAVLLLNVAILIYLIYRIRKERKQKVDAGRIMNA